MITRKQLIQRYIDFFKSKHHRHIPPSPLIPANDPTVLFTTAGMHPLVPYLLGQKHPLGKRLVSVQKCIRTGDVDEVGDEVHHTFFEMLGNWSLGDYFKEDAIMWSYEFLTDKKWLGISPEKISVTCFKGDSKLNIKKDIASESIWLAVGIPSSKIKFLGMNDNWWGPAGKTGPCGPDTEMFYKTKNGDVEIWNDVFMEYNKTTINAILVDAINCLINKEKGLNKELAEFLKDTNKKIIVVTNADKDSIKHQIKGYDFEVFSMDKNPEKLNPIYFRKLLESHKLNEKEVIYFDHKKENINSAKSIGIQSELYQNNSQIKNFVEQNLHIYVFLKQKNVDTGMGVERTLSALNELNDDYLTDSFLPIIKEIEKISGKKYGQNKRSIRIIADHIKASTFILSEKITPSNTEQGYVLRRLIRRAIRYGKKLGMKENFTSHLSKKVLEIYPEYNELHKNHKFIIEQLDLEENRFNETLEKGLKQFEKLSNDKLISGKEAFLLFQSYGFPIEITQELAEEKGIKIDLEEFNNEFKRHQDLSRTTSSGMFKSGLADDSNKTRKLHTATHLLNEALRRVLGHDVAQRGSNITPERLRFDFNFPRKLTQEEIKKVEKLINEKIKAGLNVHMIEMPLSQAQKLGAQAEFGDKYPELVSVYTIEDKKEKSGWFSKEICTGPHVSNTKDVGKFKIIKEESVASGVRRIKGIIE